MHVCRATGLLPCSDGPTKALGAGELAAHQGAARARQVTVEISAAP